MRFSLRKYLMILSVAITLCVFNATYASEENTLTNDSTISVNGTYDSSKIRKDAICVRIEWSNTEFIYDAGVKGEWDVNTHSYIGSTPAGWCDDAMTITVTNDSNVSLTATLLWVQNDQFTGKIDGTFTVNGEKNNMLVLESADAEKYRNQDETGIVESPSASAQFRLSGDGIEKDENNIGTVVVTIGKTSQRNT